MQQLLSYGLSTFSVYKEYNSAYSYTNTSPYKKTRAESSSPDKLNMSMLKNDPHPILKIIAEHSVPLKGNARTPLAPYPTFHSQTPLKTISISQ